MSLDLEITLTCDLLDEDDVDCVFRVDYAPGTPDVMYMSNGDPGYPGDGPELEVLRAQRAEDRADLKDVDFRDWSAVESKLYALAADQYVDMEQEARADYRYDDYLARINAADWGPA